MVGKLLTPVSLVLALAGLIPRSAAPSAQEAITIDDFESYSDGSLPTRWKYLQEQELVWLDPSHMRPNEQFYVTQDPGNNFLRAYTHDEAVHLTMANEKDGFDWDLRTHPVLRWDWRALQLPKNAREDSEQTNDTGIALYVYFSFEGFIIKRPKGIKYTYSSSLPVGTVLKQDKLRVIVVANGAEGFGHWMRMERNMIDDYRAVFGDDPPHRPLSIRLWSDSDNTGDFGEGDFDNITLVPGS
ncbi:MAG: DUF3047 domain-containing protein [Rhodothermales bacterium]|nr:DUF3047 domain-containing protein [Rhodothermales bacterium]